MHSTTDEFFGYLWIVLLWILMYKLYLKIALNSFWYIPKSEFSGWWGNILIKLLRNFHIAFHSGCTILYSHQQCKCCNFSISLPRLFFILNCSHLSKYEGLFHCGFEFQFTNDEWCWPPFLMLVDHFNIFIGQFSID